MAAALANSKSFWQQVHRVNKSKSSTPATSVDYISAGLQYNLSDGPDVNAGYG